MLSYRRRDVVTSYSELAILCILPRQGNIGCFLVALPVLPLLLESLAEDFEVVDFAMSSAIV